MSDVSSSSQPSELDATSPHSNASNAATIAITHDGEYPVISTQHLFKQHNAVRIEHRGQHYLLRLTREKKLILTK
jgi:hemin uptake protein HemP